MSTNARVSRASRGGRSARFVLHRRSPARAGPAHCDPEQRSCRSPDLQWLRRAARHCERRRVDRLARGGASGSNRGRVVSAASARRDGGATSAPMPRSVTSAPRSSSISPAVSTQPGARRTAGTATWSSARAAKLQRWPGTAAHGPSSSRCTVRRWIGWLHPKPCGSPTPTSRDSRPTSPQSWQRSTMIAASSRRP